MQALYQWGSFVLSKDGENSSPIPFDASGEDLQRSLEMLNTVDQVMVSRIGPDSGFGYTWSVTFYGASDAGNIDSMICESSGLTANTAACLVATVVDGVKLSEGLLPSLLMVVSRLQFLQMLPQRMDSRLQSLGYRKLVDHTKRSRNPWRVSLVDCIPLA